MTERQLFLRTTALDLVLLSTDDALALARWLNDQEVTQYLARGDYPMSFESEVEYLNKVYKDDAHLQLGLWHRKDQKLVGTAGMHRINDRDQTAEFGIMIGESAYWGQGLGTQTLEAMLKWAFTTRNLRNVTLRVLGNNPRGQRCYEKCGFAEVGRFPKHIFKAGQWHDGIFMICHNPAYR